MTGDVYVPPGRTLTILPGTVVRFAVRSDPVNHPGGQNNCPAPKAELIVEGTLNARGTKVMPILFTSDGILPKPGDWGGIILYGDPRPVTLSHLIIEYADVNLMAFRAGIVVENCIIRNAYGGLDDCPTAEHWGVRQGLFLHGERSIVRNCEIANCTWGIQVNQDDPTKAAIRIENCYIHDNNVTSPGFDVPNGIHLFKSNAHIEGNTIENNDWGIEVGVSRVVVIDNTFSGNSFGVVYYYEDERDVSQGYLCNNQTVGNGMDYTKMTPWGPKSMPEDWFHDPYDTSGDSPNATNSDTAFTQIVIDGQSDDWSGYRILKYDYNGDASGGGFDLKSVRAFTNDQYLYLMIEAHGNIGEYVQIDLDIDIDSDGRQDYMATFRPRTGQRDFGDFTSGERVWRSMVGGEAAEGKVVEFKMPLALIGRCESFTLMNIRVMNGVCCGEQWYGSEDTGTVYVARSDEIEAPVSQRTERPGHVLMAAGDAEADYLYRGFVQVPGGIAWGPDGHLYVADQLGRHVVRLAPDGSMDDLDIWRNPDMWNEDGPHDVAFNSKGNLFVSDHAGGIYAIGLDGSMEVLPGIRGQPVCGVTFNPHDELYYTDGGGGRVFKIGADGNSQVVARGIENAFDLVFGSDGTLYVSQNRLDRVVRVDVTTGEVNEFFSAPISGAQVYLAIDTDGDLWIRGCNTLYQLASDGTQKPFYVNGRRYFGDTNELDIQTAGGITFDDEGRLWIASYNSSIRYLEPLLPGDDTLGMTMTVIAPGFAPGFIAADLEVSHDGYVYVYNNNPTPGELWQVSPEGEIEVLLHLHERGNVGMALDDQGKLYLGLPNGEIAWLDTNGKLRHYAWLHSWSMTFAVDGYLYAVAGADGEPRSVVRIVGRDNYETLIAQIDGKPLGGHTGYGPGSVHIDPAPGKGLYIYDESHKRVYYVDFDGRANIVADVPGIGAPAAMAVSPEGDTFVIAHDAPGSYGYSLLWIQPDGHKEIYAREIYGDPLGAVVSSDGRWLYIAENGAIDKIPIIRSN